VNYLRKLLNDAQAAGYRFRVYSDETGIDYEGTHPAEAYEAATACDLMYIDLVKANGRVESTVMVIPELEPEEVISDFAGSWATQWWEQNIGSRTA